MLLSLMLHPADLLQSGLSPVDVDQVVLMHDLTRLEDELDQIEPLFIKIRDRRNKTPPGNR